MTAAPSKVDWKAAIVLRPKLTGSVRTRAPENMKRPSASVLRKPSMAMSARWAASCTLATLVLSVSPPDL